MSEIAIPALIDGYEAYGKGSNLDSRIAVEDAIVSYGAEAVPYLVDDLGMKRRHGLTWIELMARIGPDTEPALAMVMNYLDDRTRDYRVFAAQALGRIGVRARDAVPRLEEILKDPRELPEVLGAVVLGYNRNLSKDKAIEFFDLTRLKRRMAQECEGPMRRLMQRV
jgi:hypothetical protein